MRQPRNGLLLFCCKIYKSLSENLRIKLHHFFIKAFFFLFLTAKNRNKNFIKKFIKKDKQVMKLIIFQL